MTDPAHIARTLSAAERKAMMHREGASEACMSWDVARSLYGKGLTLRNARFLRLTWLGSGVRAALQNASAMSAGTAETQSGSGLQPASAVGEAETPKGSQQ